jgi:hypothetical protein
MTLSFLRLQLAPSPKVSISPNFLSAAFMLIDPESVKNTVKSSVSFTLLGSSCVKAVLRILMKLTLLGSILPNFFCQAKSCWCSAFGKKFWAMYVKFRRCLTGAICQKSIILFAQKTLGVYVDEINS